MLTAVALLVLPTLVACSGEGNIHLLEDDVAIALHSCSHNESTDQTKSNGRNHRSLNVYDYHRHVPRIDNAKPDDMDLYAHEKRNSTQMDVLNGKEEDIPSFGRTDQSVKYVKTLKTATMPTESNYNYTGDHLVRQRRSDYLIHRSDQDQCLSQCVFANLHVVDERGIPRETELWNKVQAALTSQQSRTVLRDQIRACFQELRSEDEENGCSYSNKLERCLVLRFSDRKLNSKT